MSKPIRLIIAILVGILFQENSSAADCTSLSTAEGAPKYSSAKINEHFSASSEKLYVLAHYLTWWGNGEQHGRAPCYLSGDPNNFKNQIEKMKFMGLDGIIVNWFGPNTYTETAWDRQYNKNDFGKDFAFAMMIDRGALRTSSSCSRVCDPTEVVQTYITRLRSKYFYNPGYLSSEGKKVLFEFGLDEEASINWRIVHRQNPDVAIIRIHPKGFKKPSSGGAFAWPLPDTKDISNEKSRWLRELEGFYATARKTQLPATGVIFPGFDDSSAPWGQRSPRKIDHDCGRTWLKTVDLAKRESLASGNLRIIQIATWNDYDEGTEVEDGIDGCFRPKLTQNGMKLNIHIDNPTIARSMSLTLPHRAAPVIIPIPRDGSCNYVLRNISPGQTIGLNIEGPALFRNEHNSIVVNQQDSQAEMLKTDAPNCN